MDKKDALHLVLTDMLNRRVNDLKTGDADEVLREQRHLDPGSEQRAYWHFGYASALKDVVRILEGAGQSVN